MDNNQLFEVISKKPALWDKNNADYYNHDLKVTLWKEVTQELGTSLDTVKQSLRELRTYVLSKPSLKHDILCFEYMLIGKELIWGKSKSRSHKIKRKSCTREDDKGLSEKIKIQIIEAIFEDDRDDYYSSEYTTKPTRAITYT